MIVRSALMSLCLAASLAAASVSLAAAEIISESAPPAPKVEIMPPARDGYVWSPGHWEWSGHSYYWIGGSWVVQRRGAHYVPSSWEQRGAQWHFVKEHWEH